MESKYMLASIAVIWVAAMFVSIFAPAFVTGGNESIPITSWVAPTMAAIATFFVARWGKQS